MVLWARHVHKLVILMVAVAAALLFGAVSAGAYFVNAHGSGGVARHPARWISDNVSCAGGFVNPAYPNRNYTASNNSACSAYTVQNRTVSSALTFPANGVTVEAGITVNNGVTLTVPAGAPVTMTSTVAPTYASFDVLGDLAVGAGVTFTFTSDAQGLIAIESGGLLDMSAGTVLNPIKLTSSTTTPGDWEGLLFLNNSNGTLTNVKILYAGAAYTASACANTPSVSTAVFTCGGAPAITSSTVQYSAGNGVEVSNSGVSPTLTGDLISNNASNGLIYDTLPLSLNVVSSLTINNNGSNHLALSGGTWNAGQNAPSHILQNVGVSGQPVPIDVYGSLTVGSNDTLKVGAGTTLSFVTGGTLTVNGTADLSAGTATSQIVLTGPNQGTWGGVVFNSINSITAHGSLNDVQILTAGTGVSITGATPSITNSLISQSVHDAIDVHNTDGSTPAIGNVSLTNNGGNPLVYDAPPTTLSTVTGLTINSNGDNGIVIKGGIQNGTGTWPNYSVPYEITNNLTVQGSLTVGNGTQIFPMTGNLSVPASGTLNLGPGTTVAFTSGNASVLSIGGTLNATGTSDLPSGRIVLTSAAPIPAAGDWGGLQTRGTTSLSHVLVQYAGASTSCCLDNNPHADGIYVYRSTPTIGNTTVDSSGGNGIEVNNFNGTTATLSTVSLTNNSGYALSYDYLPNTLAPLTGMTISQNGNSNAIYLAGGYQNGTGVWPNFSPQNMPNAVPYSIGGSVYVNGSLSLGANTDISPLNGDLLVNNGGSLTAGAGTTIAFTGGAAHTLNSSGTLDLSQGTANSPITVTSTSLSPGSWGGIQDNGTATFNYVNILYAGAYIGNVGSFGLLVGSGESPSVTNSLIQSSGGNDVQIVGGSSATFNNDDFETVGGGFYGILNNDPAHPVTATYNYWGDPSGPYNATLNPSGLGAQVSSGVSFVPWLGYPQVVTNLAASGGNGQATATWGVPSYNGGAAIDKYDVSVSLATGGPPIQGLTLDFADCTPMPTCVIVKGLANGTAYTIYVQAHNKYGDGQAVTVNVTTRPGIPSSLAAQYGDAQAGLSWGPPADIAQETAQITDYQVTVKQHSNGAVAFSDDVLASTCNPNCADTATGLSNGVLYDVSVSAVNSSGAGLPATTQVTPSTTPDAVSNLGYTSGNGSVTLTWTPGFNGGAALDSYAVVCNPGNHTPSSAVAGTATSAVVPNLTNGVAYTCSVTPHNMNGSGPAATISPVYANPPASIGFTNNPQIVVYGTSTPFTVTGSDTDGDSVTMAVTSPHCTPGVAGGNCLPDGLIATPHNGQSASVSITGGDTSPAGTYTVSFSANDGYTTTVRQLTIQVNPLPVTVTLSSHTLFALAQSSGTSGVLSVNSTIKDSPLDTAGTFTNANPVTYTLTPVGSFGVGQMCTSTTRVVSRTMYAPCSFNHVPVGAYLLTVSTNNLYYQGQANSVLTVYSRTSIVAGAGVTTVSGARTEIAFYATNAGGLQGGMLVVQHGPGGDTVLTSTSLTNLNATASNRSMTLQGNAAVGNGPSDPFTLQISAGVRATLQSTPINFTQAFFSGGVYITNQ